MNRNNKNRINKDFHFIGKTNYNGLDIDGLSLYFEYIIISKETGKEIFIAKEDKDTYFKSNYKCFVDEKNGYHLELKSNKTYYKNKEVAILISPTTRASIWNNQKYQINIDFNLGIEILKECFIDFNNVDNNPTQSLFYNLIEQNN